MGLDVFVIVGVGANNEFFELVIAEFGLEEMLLEVHQSFELELEKSEFFEFFEVPFESGFDVLGDRGIFLGKSALKLPEGFELSELRF